jgi:hypothetical protein
MEGRGRIYATLSVPLNGYYRRNEICLSPPASSQLYATGLESSYNSNGETSFLVANLVADVTVQHFLQQQQQKAILMILSLE